MQVHTVFERYARGTGLRVGLAIGQTNFLEEQLALVGATALAGEADGAASDVEALVEGLSCVLRAVGLSAFGACLRVD